MSEMPERLSRLREFKCHKVVHAAKIVAALRPPASVLHLDPGDGGEPCVHEVPQEFFVRQRAEVGGYFVRYEDGYQSYSPAEAFESGYRPLEHVLAEETSARFTAEKLDEAKARIEELERLNSAALDKIKELEQGREALKVTAAEKQKAADK